MNILWLSWRDIKNPQSGGAEKVAIEVAKRFVRDNSNVTIFTSRFEKSKPQEKIDGVNIIRKGNQLTCRFFAFLYYRKNPNFDIVIDEINTIPFFTNFYAKSKSIVLIHQLAKEYWFKQTFFPLNIIGYLLEAPMLKQYRSKLTLTVSNSTKKDLKTLKFSNVQIIREGLSSKPVYPQKKQSSILFLGRLSPIKKPLDAIHAFNIILKTVPEMKLILIGRGNERYVKYLKKEVKKLKLTKFIHFEGFITNPQKYSLLRKAKVVLIPSIREGWGLITIEANAQGCVPIAYNVPGLKDSIVNGQTGLLVKNKPELLAKAAVSLLTNKTLLNKLAKNGYDYSKQFNWENCYQDFKNIINNLKTPNPTN